MIPIEIILNIVSFTENPQTFLIKNNLFDIIKYIFSCQSDGLKKRFITSDKFLWSSSKFNKIKMVIWSFENMFYTMDAYKFGTIEAIEQNNVNIFWYLYTNKPSTTDLSDNNILAIMIKHERVEMLRQMYEIKKKENYNFSWNYYFSKCSEFNSIKSFEFLKNLDAPYHKRLITLPIYYGRNSLFKLVLSHYKHQIKINDCFETLNEAGEIGNMAFNRHKCVITLYEFMIESNMIRI